MAEKCDVGIDLPISENDLHLMRHRPPSLSQLSRSSGFSSRQVQFLYRNFKQECPNGLMSQTSFKNVFIQLFPFGGQLFCILFVTKMFSAAKRIMKWKKFRLEIQKLKPQERFKRMLTRVEKLRRNRSKNCRFWSTFVDFVGFLCRKCRLSTFSPVLSVFDVRSVD